MQMATNLSSMHGQTFVRGRRVHHTDFGDGSHDEGGDNRAFDDLAGALGPRYVNRSCAACHERNGRAMPPSVGEELDQYVVRVGDATGAPVPELGAVLRSRVTDGEPESAARLSGWTAVGDLRAPAYAFTGEAPAHYSVRIAPQLVGMGLLEAIPEADVQALADPDDANGDGISGRMRIVEDVETGERRLGRFGWKAAEPRVAHQVAAALDMDMGVRTSLRPGDDVGPDVDDVELDDAHLRDLTAYVSLLGVSARRGLASVDALRGEALFAEIGCAACHTPTFRTSSFHPHAELRDQTTHPYTDLLLHDMGPRLASTLIEGGASAAEWRTAPLWNIGLTARVSGAEAYLHDGRARSLEEAILWRGGAGAAARAAYLALPDDRRGELIAFLRSL